MEDVEARSKLILIFILRTVILYFTTTALHNKVIVHCTKKMTQWFYLSSTVILTLLFPICVEKGCHKWSEKIHWYNFCRLHFLEIFQRHLGRQNASPSEISIRQQKRKHNKAKGGEHYGAERSIERQEPASLV